MYSRCSEFNIVCVLVFALCAKGNVQRIPAVLTFAEDLRAKTNSEYDKGRILADELPLSWVKVKVYNVHNIIVNDILSSYNYK